jgi:hypothetical protein
VAATPAPPPPEPGPKTELSNGPAEHYHPTADRNLDDSPDGEPVARPSRSPARAAAAVAPPEPPAPRPGGRRAVALVVDAAVFLILVAGGVFAAEVLLGKSSAEVLRGSAAAPKFPPTDLLIWLAGPVLAGLIYLWLGTRGWTVGGWLRRRRAA